MAVNYYVLLGIPRNASQADIKSAYRQKAKELHPDVCTGDREPFLAIQEAYEVLSDPARRRMYDAREARARASRAREARARQARRPGAAPLWRQMVDDRRVEPLRSTSRPVEPLVPDSPTERWGWESLWSDGDDWVEQVDVEVTLTSEQARYGGRVEVHIPIQIACPACRGQGGRGFAMCSRCAGRGRIAVRRALRLSFPGGIAEGDTARVRLDRVGIPGVELVVRFILENSQTGPGFW